MNASSTSHFIYALIVLVACAFGYSFWYSVVAAESAAGHTVPADVSAQGAVLNSHFVSTANAVPFIQQLQTVGAGLGTKVSVVSVAADTGTKHPQLSLTLKVAGQWSDVVRTIGVIEYAPYYLTVQSISLADTGTSWSATLHLTAASL